MHVGTHRFFFSLSLSSSSPFFHRCTRGRVLFSSRCALLRRWPQRRVVIAVNERATPDDAQDFIRRRRRITRSFSSRIEYQARRRAFHSVHLLGTFLRPETGIRARYFGRGLIDLSAGLIVRPTAICRVPRQRQRGEGGRGPGRRMGARARACA